MAASMISIMVVNIMVTIIVVINIMAIWVIVTLITQVENACHWWMPASDTWELGPKMSRRRYQVFRYQGHCIWISRTRTFIFFRANIKVFNFELSNVT